MTDGEIKLENLIATSKNKKNSDFSQAKVCSQRKQSSTSQDWRGRDTQVRERDHSGKTNEEDVIIGSEMEYMAKTGLFIVKDVKECGWEELYLEVADPSTGCLCSLCPMHAIVSNHRNTIHSKHSV